MRRGKVRFNHLDIDLVNQNTDDLQGERKRQYECYIKRALKLKAERIRALRGVK